MTVIACRIPSVARRTLSLAAAAAVSAAPLAARSHDGAAGPEPVAEALFLCDALPPGGRDVNLSLALARGEPDPETGEAALLALPRVQLAIALAERVGLTADIGLADEGGAALDAPGASLKLLLREPRDGRTGFGASLDLFGSTHSVTESEAGFGLGAIRPLGRFALRASASVASGVGTWSPHLHAGVSAAAALGARWRALAEVVAGVAGGELEVSAGPTVKVALGEGTALMAGALFELARGAGAPAFLVQLTQSM